MQVVTRMTAAKPVATPATITTVSDATVSAAPAAVSAAPASVSAAVTAVAIRRNEDDHHRVPAAVTAVTAAEAAVTPAPTGTVSAATAPTESASRSRTGGRNRETRAYRCYR